MLRAQTALALLGGLIFASVARGADAPIMIREAYWQVLPAAWAYVDAHGRPWLSRYGGDVAQSYHHQIGELAADQVLLLGDRARRVWVNPRYQSEPTKFFDGRDWHDTGIHGRTAFEDSSGRIFIADATCIHVFDGTERTKQQVYPQESYADGQFVQDAQGRVWFWATDFRSVQWGNRAGTRGLWCHDRGKWANYNQDSGLTLENIEFLFPLADDRFLILGALDPTSGLRPYLVWSPSREVGGTQDFLGLKSSGRVDHGGVDLDGLAHFIFQGDGGSGSATRVVVSARGEARALSETEAERAARMPVGLYTNSRYRLGRLSEAPPVVPCQPSEAICRDGLGRIYFRYPTGIGVVWPKFEQPGDVIRLMPNPQNIAPIFQTRDGKVWGAHYNYRMAFEGAARDGVTCLLHWDGRTWADMPVKVLPHPDWSMHSSPPWEWARRPLFLPQGDTVLAVQIRDVYQEVQAAAIGDEFSYPQRLLRAAGEEEARRGEARWYEAWLHHEGRWSGPERLPEFLERRWSVLAEEFRQPARNAEWLAIAGDGRERLWAAYESTLWAIDKDGVKKWNIPIDSRTRVMYHLCRLPDGRMMLCLCGEKGPSLWMVSIRDGEIAAEKFAEPEGWLPSRLKPPTVMVARDRTIWLTSGVLVCRLRNDRWEKRPDLADFLFEDADGSLWFRPGEEYQHGANRGYRVVKGDQTKTYPWPIDYEFGDLTPVGDGRVLIAAGYWLVQLDNADDATKRTIAKPILADRYLGNSPVFKAPDGTIFVNGRHGK